MKPLYNNGFIRYDVAADFSVKDRKRKIMLLCLL